MNKIIIALAIVLAILVGLLAFFLIREKNDAKKPAETNAVQTEEVTEPIDTTELTEAPQTEATEQTEAPEETDAPEETAPATEATEETEEPTETTEPAGVDATNSGQFTSNTGSGLELVVDWQTYASADGTKMVRFDVSINCLSINVGSRIDGVHITMDGATKSFDCDGVTASGGRASHLIASCVLEMAGDSANVDVSWDFRGTYSNVRLEKVTASGTVTR